jgi:L,D-transpeptidase ErfK/SrfK
MKYLKIAFFLLLPGFPALVPAVAAQAYFLPPRAHDLVGRIGTVVIDTQETLADVAREHNVGHEEIRLANPTIEFWLPQRGATVLLPKLHILPRAERRGIVLNVPEMRLYHFPQPCGPDAECMVVTHPVSIGRMDWNTPLGTTHVTRKLANPSWYPPESIRREAAERGSPLPERVLPGPDNPLGAYALYLDLPTYRIHGTNRPYGVGIRATHGCIRMYPEDIEMLYREVAVGTPVQIVSQPVKFGWELDTLYIEVHPPLEEDDEGQAKLAELARAELQEIARGRSFRLDEAAFERALAQMDGIPVVVSLGERKG